MQLLGEVAVRSEPRIVVDIGLTNRKNRSAYRWRKRVYYDEYQPNLGSMRPNTLLWFVNNSGGRGRRFGFSDYVT